MKILNKSMLKNASQLAKSIRANSIFVYIDALNAEELVLDLHKDCELVVVSKKHRTEEE